MNINFELLLTMAVVLMGIVCLADMVYFARQRDRAAAQLTAVYDPNQRAVLQQKAHMSKLVEYSLAFFPVLLLVLLLRSFVVEPFRIPSGSLEPTLLPGDFILANKFTYGLRLPVLHNKIWALHNPQTGQIMVLRFPLDPSVDYIKRVIGVPGDKITYAGKILFINGNMQPQTFVGDATDSDGQGNIWPVEIRNETINGIKHNIYVRDDMPSQDFTVIVPPNHYFVMGDNRDDSYDSRYWGFVPDENIVGKAFFVWLSFDSVPHHIQWGNWVNLNFNLYHLRVNRLGSIINK